MFPKKDFNLHFLSDQVSDQKRNAALWPKSIKVRAKGPLPFPGINDVEKENYR